MAAEKRDSMGIVPATEHTGEHPAWLEAEILRGIHELAAHPLVDRPKETEETELAASYARTLHPGTRWDEERDQPRIREAFVMLAKGHRKRGVMDVSRFPNAHDLMDALRLLRPDPEYDPFAPLSPEQLERAQDAKQRAIRLMTSANQKQAQSVTERMERINIRLRVERAPEFKSTAELRHHIKRQKAVGELIAELFEEETP